VKTCCAYDNSNNICARLFVLGYMLYQDDISDVSNFGGDALTLRLQGVIMGEKLPCVHDNSKKIVLGSSYCDVWCIRMISRTYQILVVMTSILRLQGVIMGEKMPCVHDNSKNICARFFIL